jgi:hypothetical protein
VYHRAVKNLPRTSRRNLLIRAGTSPKCSILRLEGDNSKKGIVLLAGPRCSGEHCLLLKFGNGVRQIICCLLDAARAGHDPDETDQNQPSHYKQREYVVAHHLSYHKMLADTPRPWRILSLLFDTFDVSERSDDVENTRLLQNFGTYDLQQHPKSICSGIVSIVESWNAGT